MCWGNVLAVVWAVAVQPFSTLQLEALWLLAFHRLAPGHGRLGWLARACRWELHGHSRDGRGPARAWLWWEKEISVAWAAPVRTLITLAREAALRLPFHRSAPGVMWLRSSFRV